MNKTTIELTRIKKHWSGYGLMNQPFTQDSAATLEAICVWSAKPENKGQTVYRHAVRDEIERVGEDGLAYVAGCSHSESGKPMTYSLSYNIPYCDLVYYLDIYHQ